MIENTMQDANKRFDTLSEIFWDSEKSPPVDVILQALRDEDDAIRADALDYLIFRSDEEPEIKLEVVRMLEREESFICLCRLAVLSPMWKITDSTIVNIVRPSLYDILYLHVWLTLLDVINGTRAAHEMLDEFSLNSDFEIAELARNLASNLKLYRLR